MCFVGYLYCIELYCIALHCIVLYCIVTRKICQIEKRNVDFHLYYTAISKDICLACRYISKTSTATWFMEHQKNSGNDIIVSLIMHTFTKLLVARLAFLAGSQCTAVLASKSREGVVTGPGTFGDASAARLVTGRPQRPETITTVHGFVDKPSENVLNCVGCCYV